MLVGWVGVDWKVTRKVGLPRGLKDGLEGSLEGGTGRWYERWSARRVWKEEGLEGGGTVLD